MSLAVTTGYLMTACREHAGMENSTFITDAELVRLINASVRRFFTLLVSARGQGYFQATTSFSLQNGISIYPLEVDFFQLLTVSAVIGSETVTMHPYMEEERNAYLQTPYVWGPGVPMYYRLQGGNISFIPTPTGAASIILKYIPVPAPLSASMPNQTIDGIAGWDDFVVWDVVSAMLAKEESDNSFAISQREMIRADIMGLAAERDAGQPERVQDVIANSYGPWRF